MSLDVIDWKLIGTCNLRCLHCYGPPKSQQALEHEYLVQIVDKFKELSAKWVVLTGGEPLLVPRIDAVLQKISESGMQVALSTNGTYFKPFKDSIEKYVSSLNIPLDGSTPQIHALSRADKESYHSFFGILNYYRENPKSKPKLLRVGTVYSTANQSDFVSMAKRLEPYAEIIDTWKIYELIDYDIQQDLRAQIRMESSNFRKDMDALLADTSLASKIMLSPKSARDRAFFMVNPKGEVVVPTDVRGVTREIPVGSLLHDPLEKIVEQWNAFSSSNNYKGNHAHYGKVASTAQ